LLNDECRSINALGQNASNADWLYQLVTKSGVSVDCLYYFFFVARAIKKIVRNLMRDRRQARNLGMVLGRLAQGVTILVGLFIALSIVIPSLKAGDLVQLLGISSVAIAVIAPFTHTKADRAALLRHANMIDRGSQEGIVEELDRNDVKERYLAAVKAIEQR